MTERVSFDEFDREVAAFQVRLQELRTQRILDGEAGDEAAAAAFLELETAAEELRVAHEELWVAGNELARRTAPNDRDRDVLRVVFRDLPLAVILLDRSGRIRRVNQRAVDLLGVTADYLSGKPFPVFVDLPARAALRSHLAAVARGKDEQVISTNLLRQGNRIPARLALSTVQVPADDRPVIMAVVLPADGDLQSADPAAFTGEGYARPWADRPQAVRAATRRLDLIIEVARLLLGEEGRAEAVMQHALAALLCGTFADWVSIDRLREGHLTRASVCGPADPASLSTLGALERAVVGKAELPRDVVESGQTRLDCHVEDQTILGEDERGVPFVSAMGAHSVLCVAIESDGQTVGAITALRGRDRDPFSLSEQATLEDVAALLARALRWHRRSDRRSVPGVGNGGGGAARSVTAPPGLDAAFFQRSAGPAGAVPTTGLDVYPALTGWGFFLGDTVTAGGPAADYLSMVRQWARLLGLTEDDPGALVTQLNWAMRRLGGTDLQVAATAGHVDATGARARIRLAHAGRHSSLALRTDGRVQRVDGGGQPLNGADAADVHAAVIELDRGDLLLLYNDALFDARGSAGAGFGQSGQLRIALARAAGGSAQDAVDEVTSALDAFTDDEFQLDVFAAGVRFTGP